MASKNSEFSRVGVYGRPSWRPVMNGFRTAVERRDGRRDGQQARQARSGKGRAGKKGRTKWGNKQGQERTPS